MRLIGRRFKTVNVPPGADELYSAYPLPAGGKINSVWQENHIQSTALVPFVSASMYGMDGFVVPMLDADSGVNLNTMWDQQVPKDIAYASGVFDIDTGATDATPVFEIGEPDWSAVMDLATLEPREIFRRRRMLSFASGLGHATYDRAAGNFYPLEVFTTTVKRNIRTANPAYIMFGFSSPSLDITTTTQEVAISENQWSQLQFLEDTLKQAFISLLGLVEAGAETPWAEAASFIAQLIEDTVYETVGGTLQPTTWQIISRSTYDITVPGTLEPGVLTSE